MNAENPNERMNRRSLLTRLMLLLVALTAGLQVQADEPRFYVYNASNGLADNSAQTIYCTKTGRLVITTMGQINFFDGNNFTYIDPSRENTYHLSNYTGNGRTPTTCRTTPATTTSISTVSTTCG